MSDADRESSVAHDAHEAQNFSPDQLVQAAQAIVKFRDFSRQALRDMEESLRGLPGAEKLLQSMRESQNQQLRDFVQLLQKERSVSSSEAHQTAVFSSESAYEAPVSPTPIPEKQPEVSLYQKGINDKVTQLLQLATEFARSEILQNQTALQVLSKVDLSLPGHAQAVSWLEHELSTLKEEKQRQERDAMQREKNRQDAEKLHQSIQRFWEHNRSRYRTKNGEIIQDYYRILNVDDHATEDEIKAQWRRGLQIFHTDGAAHDQVSPEDVEQTKEISQLLNEAKDELLDSAKRRNLDSKLADCYEVKDMNAPVDQLHEMFQAAQTRSELRRLVEIFVVRNLQLPGASENTQQSSALQAQRALAEYEVALSAERFDALKQIIESFPNQGAAVILKREGGEIRKTLQSLDSAISLAAISQALQQLEMKQFVWIGTRNGGTVTRRPDELRTKILSIIEDTKTSVPEKIEALKDVTSLHDLRMKTFYFLQKSLGRPLAVPYFIDAQKYAVLVQKMNNLPGR